MLKININLPFIGNHQFHFENRNEMTEKIKNFAANYFTLIIAVIGAGLFVHGFQSYRLLLSPPILDKLKMILGGILMLASFCRVVPQKEDTHELQIALDKTRKNLDRITDELIASNEALREKQERLNACEQALSQVEAIMSQ